MESFLTSDALINPEYPGSILLSSGYSSSLKRRLAECITCYRAYEETGSTAMLYIAAWKGNDQRIWYEYIGRTFLTLFDCEPQEMSDVFRKSVKDRRIYKDLDPERGVQKEIKSNDELNTTWEELREEGEKAGTIEAVYQITTGQDKTTWLKDQANIEVFEEDNICLSFGVLTIVSKEMEAEDKLKRHHDLLETIIQDRTAELTELNLQLQKSLDEIVNAMSLTLEERDPYTAGHQRRTTDLSLAIAKEIGLPEHVTKGLQMAGLIHDMGKISVPGEILSKPGGLNDAELQLIQRHPQVAYDILNQIDFPWPVDQIVLQHHEKMDGSGYPQGLSGEEILIESRILCVADVVETMETHRPYRSSLGREAALEEITRNRGVLYDSEVVDACLKLFQETGFQYSTGSAGSASEEQPTLSDNR
jgi:HD-GYP domain-containing protein (c-di-GMP phosphodiesterase class II)